eukprot:CAMPEP_0114281078 /NCGR_PEP_ID=MMETSP0059-20121206/2786_1 /TAXON_ID=36894 /ORGANISM="Pyramimonas parkeae, Strain CCMP726" /LENGTH=755 /DNA_ID=CAMNT_0001401535 /DNA_START=189 /DNA_END=2456 /DNA_ORIENTATION=-
MESLDYETCENEIYNAHQAKRTQWHSLIHTTVKWTLCLLTGVLVSLTAFGVNMGVENIAAVKFSYTFALMEDSLLASFVVYSLFNCALVLVATVLVVYFAPQATGSGIPDVKAFLNGVDVRGVLLARTLIAKTIGCVCAVAAGLAVGKEGPFVHIGSCIASLLGQGGTKHYQYKGKWLQTVKNDVDQRELVTCGATAGVAAAFRSPVGGVLFALEEATSWWSNQLLWRSFFTTAVVSVVVRTTMKMCGGKQCGYFGEVGGFIIFEMREGQVDYQLYELLPMTMLGLIGGLLGASFNSLSARLGTWRREVLSNHEKSSRVYEAVAVAFITSLVTYILPLLSGCKECPTDSVMMCPRDSQDVHFGNYVAFNCHAPKQYNPLATLFFNTQDNAIRALFGSNTDHEFDVTSLTTFFLFFYALAILTYGISVPAGLFVPGILCGASYGRLVGYAMTEFHGGKDIDEGTYALLGAASFLGGCMRITVSLCVILLELTNNLNLLPLMMLVLLVAKAVGDATGVKAIYDMQIDLKNLPVIPDNPDQAMHNINAVDAAATPVVSFQRVEQVQRIVDILTGCSHSGYPVMATDHTGEPSFMGFILKSHLLQVLASRQAFQTSSKPRDNNIQMVASSLQLNQAWKAVSTRGLSVADVNLETADMDLYLDLAPYVNPSPYVVQEDMSLNKAYQLFRQLGLRHLAVVPKAREVSGIITRKDLLPEGFQQRFPGVDVVSPSSLNERGHTLSDRLMQTNNMDKIKIGRSV